MILQSRLLSSPWFYGALCLVTFLFGGLFQPGDWYQNLIRAPWSPPNIAFPIAWTILYVLIAWAGYLASKSRDGFFLTLWFAQLAFNAAWSWVFFGQHWLTLALINLMVIIVLASLFVARALKLKLWWPATLFIPYLVWLLLASSLNAYIVVFN